ncbi:hypothetical protein BDY24DRAFT_380588 [Mrakia frigida]|uniref:uncharacterized protein n=1 Tax=Mrakia frigida TaxID=29902 RepID=UPI003FCC24FD
MANTSQHSSSSLSTLSPPSSDHNGTPATLTSSAVLFKGPHLSIFPSVAAHIAAQLRLSPPSSLKVLNGALIGMEKTKLSHFVSEKQEYRVGDYGSAVLNGVGQRNCYQASFRHVQGRRWDYNWWDTIELDKAIYSSPPTRMFSLFGGMVALFRDNLGEFRHQLQQIFEIFGGEVSNGPSSTVTHVVDLVPSYTTTRNHLDHHGDNGCLAIHPSWITSSILHGFLLPTSLFSLDFKNPLFRNHSEDFLRAFLRTDHPQKPLEILSIPIEFVVPVLPTLPSGTPRPCFLDRRIFFDIEGPHAQLVRALSSVVSRLGGVIVSDIRACNWIVTSDRSGSSYLYGVRHPELIMGTLEHIMAHIDVEEEEPTDPRSNLLHYPGLLRSHPHALKYQQIYISKRYPSEFRRYLSTLAFLLTGQHPLLSGDYVQANHTIIIAPCSLPFEKRVSTRCVTFLDRKMLIPLLPLFFPSSYIATVSMESQRLSSFFPSFSKTPTSTLSPHSSSMSTRSLFETPNSNASLPRSFQRTSTSSSSRERESHKDPSRSGLSWRSDGRCT